MSQTACPYGLKNCVNYLFWRASALVMASVYAAIYCAIRLSHVASVAVSRHALATAAISLGLASYSWKMLSAILSHAWL